MMAAKIHSKDILLHSTAHPGQGRKPKGGA